jgi:outer membrane protein TolC
LIERYTVGQARPPVTEGTELIELTLAQAQAIALEKNLDLKVARMNPVSLDYQLQTYRAAYRPNFTGSYSYRNTLTPSNNILEGVATVTNTGQSFNTGVSQVLRWYGGPSVSASFSNSRSATNNVTARLNPSYNSGLSFSVNMQLLNGFKIDNNRNNFRTFPITREIADLDLLAAIESTKNSVRVAYWQLRSAIEQIEISRRALEIAKKSYADSLIRVEIGTAAPIDTVQFDTQVAQNEQSYLAAQIGWRTAELNFKRLLVSGTDDELYSKTINPTDLPNMSVQSVDIQAALTRALAERTDVVINRKNLEVSRLNLELTKGALRPNLSFNAGYSASGQGGTEHSGGITIPGGYGDAVSDLTSFSKPQWNLGFNISYRLGQLSEKAAYARSLISIDQAVARIKVQELTVSTAVINAGLNVDNAYKLYQASVKSREAATRQADAAQVRFDNGLLTNFEVVQTQNTLTSARLNELQRIIAYMNALAEFERVQKVGG